MRRELLVDVAERAVWTLVQAFAAAVVAAGALDLEALKVAGVAAVLAVLKGLAGTRIGDRHSAATLPGAGKGRRRVADE